jgi:hypothetical protein
MINIINKQLINFYKSRTVFKFLLFNNKYIVCTLIILALVTYLFNKYLNYFYDLNILIKSITFFLISFYLIYIKFNILLRIFSLIKGISFFYSEIKINLIEDIKTICLYFYIFNIFFISISILFILNLNKNISLIDSQLGILIDSSTSLLSFIILLFYFNRIITNKFVINTNKINPLKVLILIFILLTPFIPLNFYSNKIIYYILKNNIFKIYSIFRDYFTKDNTNFNNKKKK